MRNNPFLAASLAVLVLVAGCTGTQEADESTTGDGNGGLPLPNITVPMLQFEGCRDHLISMVIPRDGVNQVLPTGDFRPKGHTDVTAAIIMEVYDCEKIVNETAVLGPAHLFWGYIPVETINATWAHELHDDNYLLEVVVDNALVAGALGALLPEVSLGTFDLLRTPTDLGLYADAWTVSTQDFSMDARFETRHGIADDAAHEMQVWWGRSPYGRGTYASNFTSISNLYGEASFGGESRIETAIGSPNMISVTGGIFVDVSFTFQYDGTWKTEVLQ